MKVFEERGKPEYQGENLSEQRREPTNPTHICDVMLRFVSVPEFDMFILDVDCGRGNQRGCVAEASCIFG